MVVQPSELHGDWIHTSRRRQEEADTPQQLSPLGRPLSVQGLCWWSTSPLYPALSDPENAWALSLLALWRTLRSIPYPCKSLAEWFLLAKHVWRRQRICPALPKMSEEQEHQFPRCYTLEEQSSSRNFRHMGSRLHGSLPYIRAMRVHPSGCGLCVTLGLKRTKPSKLYMHQD